VATPDGKNARLFYRAGLQRLDDARFLNEAARTTAAVYLGGYSVECMIKALILSRVPEAQQGQAMALFRGARAHDFGWLMGQYTERGGQAMPRELSQDYARVNTWRADMRYSPKVVKDYESAAFVASVVRIVKWADGRL